LRADLDPRLADRPQGLQITPMTSGDIRAVLRIEALSFSSSWPPSAFHSELNDNKLAHYFVGRARDSDEAEAVLAYGGLWVIL
jgi:hypothetical protein